MSTQKTAGKRETLIGALKNPARWSMLKELTHGKAVTIAELAAVAQITTNSATKHLQLLKQCGLVEAPRGHLYQLTPACQCDPTVGTIDLGFLLVRFRS